MATSKIKCYETSMGKLCKLSSVKESTSKFTYIKCEKKYFKIHSNILLEYVVTNTQLQQIRK